MGISFRTMAEETSFKNKIKVCIFGGIGAGKSCLVNSVLGQTALVEKQFSEDVCHRTEYIPATLDGAPVVMIETPGLDGQGLSFSKTKMELESNLESVDK